jgi:hypothetical protein
LRACCDQFELLPHDSVWLVLGSGLLAWREPPLLVPPLSTMIVDSPSRALTYSAVCWSLTAKKTELTFERKVWSPPSLPQHLPSWPSD